MTPEGMTRLKLDEGFREKVYDDANGKTIMHGSGNGNPTIGYGRNLVGRGITEAEAEMLLTNDLLQSWRALCLTYPWMNTMPPVWQDVVEMVDYNTGNVRGFPRMLAYLQVGNGKMASAELLNSKAALQLPARYQRMSNALLAQSWDAADA